MLNAAREEVWVSRADVVVEVIWIPRANAAGQVTCVFPVSVAGEMVWVSPELTSELVLVAAKVLEAVSALRI